MSTRNTDQKSDKSQHARSASVQKTGKGSKRMADDDANTSPVNRGKPQQHDPGNNPQTFSNKIRETGSSDELAKPRKSDQMDEDED